ncbi:hypothetical protein AUK04_00125 [Candidatus Roizmanbacteria bacterium CG2_30_33_16]|uniref:Uncharacterized protein n=4 Tax=Candidatus Roizmaniibacteriota TaxID=1752723 RepID=A0A2H0C604_9BACT|nr:hypothetical protein [Candidatus Roizmanbacteria bacterium]OIP86769.1 MAG: hypothetical protein AUK04_00125 [Candidatus Roizmanbacteria bacterium CG2_30_33_16]PIP64810.1 MAG: hypothetical protein COW96_00480 [Candidatus Roizmanbacteria bacterium CG22_combo_CG10-13_8_21_14_all_33_16]PIX74201.1 MAG: hypothetical protein COZ39_00795 [Candidatus Roizmanbacteria bacterium CG_4_10_14_3_um_filter_33_21]PJB87821.1 MAG: hypothetical protein CO083_04965 [Candidatus Roizmanbacteria bacterium CG_4_9_14_
MRNINKQVIKWVLIGVVVRLVLSFLINSPFDFFNILALSKSVADTCSLVDGFFALKRHGLEVQLYGKIFYQLTAVCLKTLEKARILEIQYLFDNKPFQDASLYLSKLFRWGPPLYQLISIKMLQLLFDGVFIFFFYKIAKIVKSDSAIKIIKFWSVTPFLMIVPYAVFQSDFLMLTSMLAGVYFWIKATEEIDKKPITINTILTFVFFALGAIIKQVPMLLIPLAIISFTKNIKTFVFHSLSALFFYVLFSQPWDKDTSLMKQYFMMSRESTAILNFQLNSTSIFILLYIFLIIVTILKKQTIFKNKLAPIYISTLLLSIIFISEDSTFLFPQFNIWILPFLALLTLVKKEYGLLFIAPIFGFIKRAMVGIDLSGLLRPTFGYGFYNILEYKDIVRGLFNPDLYGLFITSAMIVAYICLVVLLLGSLFSIKKITDFKILERFNLDLNKITALILIVYSSLFIFDFIIMTRLVLIPSKTYQLTKQKIILSTKPLEAVVDNSIGKTINGIEVKIEKNDISYVDSTVFRILDQNNNIITSQKISDFLFPVAPDNYQVILKKPIKDKKFKIQIYKDKGFNTISVFEGIFVGDIYGQTIYDNPPKEEIIKILFPKQIFEIKLRGQYEPYQMLNGVRYHINQKPIFFKIYFSIIGILIIFIITLYLLEKKHKV